MGNSNRSNKSITSSYSSTNTWINKYNYESKKPKKDFGEKHPDLQIDATLSIRQMVQRYNQGMQVPVNSLEYMDGETLHPSADLLDKQEYVERYSKIANSEIVEGVTGGEDSPPDITPDKSQETKTNES